MTLKLETLCRDNIALLEAGLRVIESLDTAQFTQLPLPIFTATAGAHFRHIIDHFDNFLTQIEGGSVDYDARAREQRVEVDRHYAAKRLQEIIGALAGFPSRRTAGPLELSALTRPGMTPLTTATHAERELVFLHNHTTHHYALVALLLRASGMDIASDFGFAPSSPLPQDVKKCAP